MKKTIREFDLKNKRVIIRCDFNVPIKDGRVVDNTRIKRSLETIRYAIRNNAKVILLSHLGKIKTEEDKVKNDMYIVYQELVKLMKKKIQFVNDTCGSEVNNAVDNLKNGQILLLQNTRYEDLDGKKESNCDIELSKYWASLGDVFINDAFGTIHRRHASNYGISKYLDSGIGFLVEEELNSMVPYIENPDRPFVVVLGGAKVSDKIKVIENLVNIADYILVGGGMCNTFLASEGYNMGNSLIDKDSIDFCSNILKKYSDKIILPIDFVVNNEFVDKKGTIKDISEISDNDIALDIGTKTIDIFKKYIKDAKQVIWNGPMGVFEFDNYKNGTVEIAKEISNNIGTTIVGGGDSVSAVNKFNLADNFSHVSTGGGASLALLEGSVLPGVENIPESTNPINFKKKNFLIIFSILLVVLFFVLKDNFIGITHIILSIKIPFLILAFLLMGIYGLLRCLSLHTIIKHFNKDFKFIKTMQNSIITVFFNGTTPFSTGGQPVQIYFLSREGLDLEKSMTVVIQNFIVYQFVLLLYGIFAIVMNYKYNMFSGVPLLSRLTFLGFLINLLVMVILLVISYTHKLDNFILSKSVDVLHKLKLVKNKMRVKKNLNKKIMSFYNSAQELKKHKKIYVKCFIYNFLSFIFLYSIPFVLSLSITNNISMSYITSFVGISYVMLIGSFVPIPGGSGGLEFAFARFFGLYNTSTITSSLIILWRFITYYFGMIIGAIVLSIYGTKKKVR